MSLYNIPEVFNSADTIYHYCGLNTAVEHILYDRKIRLSHRKKSNDPIESTKPWFSYSRNGHFEDKSIGAESIRNNSSKSITDWALNKFKNAKQLCFCMNDSAQRQINSMPEFPDEYYGFLKPRMWDQHGDKYKGVCLAFSLEALKKEAASLINRNVVYVKYMDLPLYHHSIDEIHINQLGVEEYWSKIYSILIENSMFIKHLDYKGENEYRFLSFSENEYDFINISNCLKGIIVSSYSSEFVKETLNRYADEYNVELLNIRWYTSGIDIITKKERYKQIEKTKQHIVALFNQNKFPACPLSFVNKEKSFVVITKIIKADNKLSDLRIAIILDKEDTPFWISKKRGCLMC